ncbi:MAG TPA: class I SAM-dependent methyltransferase, partial [Candidatus Binatia bacterium]|nr:class I SAM-dependent methyltransferase [Candidatus Binatia bacterium]
SPGTGPSCRRTGRALARAAELEHLLARAGFEIVALHGGFDRRPYDHESADMVVVARARG